MYKKIVFILALIVPIVFFFGITSKIDIIEKNKFLIIWLFVIIEVNLIHFNYIYKFYLSKLNKKGNKGVQGFVGPRGRKGFSQTCSSCGPAGRKVKKFGGNKNDLGQLINSDKILEGKCKFPFIYDHQMNYDCITKTTPDNTDDANTSGWCATKLDKNLNPIRFGYCNASDEVESEIQKRNRKILEKKKYLQDNKGILDIKLVSGNTSKEAKAKCNVLGPQYKVIDQDLNYGTNGKYIYMCVKEGLGNNGIGDIIISRKCEDFDSNNCNKQKNCKYDDINSKCKTNNLYKKIEQNINQDSGRYNNPFSEIYMYVKRVAKNFIKDINLSRHKTESSIMNKCPKDYKQVYDDLNKGTHGRRVDPSNQIRMCVSRKENIITIDTAFLYKNSLHVMIGRNTYKMSGTPVRNTLEVMKDFPVEFNRIWSDNERNPATLDCSKFNNDKKKCNKQSNCFYDNGSCENKTFVNAGFKYTDDHTYFFRKDMVYKYSKYGSLLLNYPKKISSEFKGIPDLIDAVFTWGKDGGTYFFKEGSYYKINPKTNELESGYPKKSNSRWRGMPKVINAIFTLPKGRGLNNKSDIHPTYVISGENIYYIDPITDVLGKPMKVKDKLIGLNLTIDLKK